MHSDGITYKQDYLEWYFQDSLKEFQNFRNMKEFREVYP